MAATVSPLCPDRCSVGCVLPGHELPGRPAHHAHAHPGACIRRACGADGGEGPVPLLLALYGAAAGGCNIMGGAAGGGNVMDGSFGEIGSKFCDALSVLSLPASLYQQQQPATHQQTVVALQMHAKSCCNG